MKQGSRTVICFLALFNIGSGEGGDSYLVVNDVKVPTYGIAGKHAVLSCFYSPIHGIYSVKWYKNGLEFYSYLPERTQPITIHPLQGVHVNVDRSSFESVYLGNLTLESTGRYRCEVSGQAPIFATDSKFGDMLVIIVPDAGPIIQGHKSRYSPGDILNVNCTTENTKPPANLTWYLNNKLVDEAYISRYPLRNRSLGFEYLHTPTLGLQYQLKQEDFSRDASLLDLKCTASMYEAYYKVAEVSSRMKKRHRQPRKEFKQRIELDVEEEKGGPGYLSSHTGRSSSTTFPSNTILSSTTTCFIFLLFSLYN